MDSINTLVVFIATVVAGSINAVAGGGTVFSFTALAWVGLPLVVANATNATALVPGSVGGIIALRRELIPQWRMLLILLMPTFLGSWLGAYVVANTPEEIFRRIVPFLVLFATLVFAGRNFLTKLVKQPTNAPETITTIGYVIGIILQFCISLYGGYFGAGIGILMLTAMSLMGMAHIINMNALKNALAIAINGTAALYFIRDGKVDGYYALVGAIGSILGGYVLASLAKHIDQNLLRAFVVVAGVIVSAWMFVRFYLL